VTREGAAGSTYGGRRVADELIDIWDENMMPIGRETRTEAHKRGLWHTAIHCWVVRPELPGYVLFRRRAAGAVTGAGLYDVTATAHPESGETVEDRLTQLTKELGLEDDDGGSSVVPLGVKIEVARLGYDVLIREFCPAYFVTSQRHPHAYELDPGTLTALVEIAIPDGLNLLAGRTERVEARGIEYDVKDGAWRRIEIDVGPPQFFPRVDPYHYKVFIMAGRLLEGARDLAV
jgi:isopentenyldiphosphate isomerase